MEPKKNIFIWVVTTLTIIFVATTYRKRLSPKISVSPNLSSVESAAPAAVEVQVPSPTPVLKVLEIPSRVKPSGICGYPQAQIKMPLISLESYLHLAKNKPKYLLLPSFHADCLPVEEKAIFRIVRYDVADDWIFDDLGQVELRLEIFKKYANYTELSFADKKFLSELGFKSVSEMVRYLGLQNAGALDELTIFKVLDSERANVRRPICGYLEYPGLRTRHANEVALEQTFKIDLRMEPNAGPIDGALRIQAPRIDIGTISSLRAVESVAELKALSGIPENKEILLIGRNQRDLRPFNFAAHLKKAGYKNVSYLREGFMGLTGYNLEAPERVPQVTTANLDELIKSLSTSMVIDTRSSSETNQFRIANAESMELLFASGQSLLQKIKLFQETFRFNQTVASDELISLIRTKLPTKIFVIGKDECDWTSIYLVQALQDRQVANVFWVRAGMDSLKLAIDLQLYPDLSSSVFSRAASLKEVRQTVTGADPKKRQATEIINLKRDK